MIADFGYAAAAANGQFHADLEKRGAPIGLMDLLIAADALSLGVELVTYDVKEFARVSKSKVED